MSLTDWIVAGVGVLAALCIIGEIRLLFIYTSSFMEILAYRIIGLIRHKGP